MFSISVALATNQIDHTQNNNKTKQKKNKTTKKKTYILKKTSQGTFTETSAI